MRLLHHLRGNAVAYLALTVALGGTSYAAVSLPKNSVGNQQLKSSAVTSAKVKDHSLLSKDFKSGQLPKGPKGDTGAAGAPGAQGPKGDTGASGATSVVVRGASGVIPAGTVGAPGYGNTTAMCNAGERATGGGASIAGVHAQLTDTIPFRTSSSAPPTGWYGQGKDTDSNADAVNVYVICAAP